MRIKTVALALCVASASACSAAGDVEGTSSSGGSTGGSTSGSIGGTASSTGSKRGTSSGILKGTSSGSAGNECPDGTPPCTDGGLCCPTGWGCVNSTCCEVPCNGSCCNSAQACVTVSGVTQCLDTCADSPHCPASAPCCIATDAGTNVCIQGDPSNGVCICSVQSDCDAGPGGTACCAPQTDFAGNPTGPYVCKPNDAEPYDCCYGLFNICSGSNCCIKDEPGNEFCADPCGTNADCPNATCQEYYFSITTTTCSGSTACGPK